MITRYLLFAFGLVSIGTAVVGIFVPFLPTTPFLLLAAACFARSSNRFHTWLIEHRFLGTYIRNYRDQRGMTRNAKILVLAAMWGVTIHNYFIFPNAWFQIGLIVLSIGVTVHILHLRTVPSREDTTGEPRQRP